ncbi:MAG TPA: quinone-dependent dihydroorotate dehydrogenase [Cryomorphaceae bacterium]|nr:quinone-dependent dihydroorotate dehydrogenase [Cryomorphaceae bacterium]
MYRFLLRPLLFKLSAERAHTATFGLIKFLFQLPFVRSIFYASYQVTDKKLEREVFGIKFKNPVGLAAGFDKDGKLFNELAYVGFGFIEVGTVTPKAQPGNPQPRLFRLLSDEAIINRMGFNNRGVEKLVKRLKRRYASVVIGGNIGKNKVTPNDRAFDDYVLCFNALYDYVDYFAVNVSSPNTPNLRELQDKKPLAELLSKLVEINGTKRVKKPILLKIAPDLTDSQLDDIIEIVAETGIDGLIATNTTISRDALQCNEEELEKIGPGGLSGKPLKNRSTEVIRYLHKNSGGTFPIIGVGGIHSAEDAMEKLNAGASLVQLYTGFICEGPSLVKRINKKILDHAENN